MSSSSFDDKVGIDFVFPLSPKNENKRNNPYQNIPEERIHPLSYKYFTELEFATKEQGFVLSYLCWCCWMSENEVVSVIVNCK